MEKFNNKLSELMYEKKMTQSMLSKLLGVSQQSISLYINGKREPDIDTLIEISKIFDVSTDYLLGVSKK